MVVAQEKDREVGEKDAVTPFAKEICSSEGDGRTSRHLSVNEAHPQTASSPQGGTKRATDTCSDFQAKGNVTSDIKRAGPRLDAAQASEKCKKRVR